jgi:hypothetical protein
MPLNDTAEANVWFNPPDQARVRAGTRRLAWSCGFAALLRDLPDPAELPLDQVRPIRDGIEHRVRGSLDELDATSGIDV